MIDIVRPGTGARMHDIHLALAEGVAAADWLTGDPDNVGELEEDVYTRRVMDAVETRLGPWYPDDVVAYLAGCALKVSRAVSNGDTTLIEGYSPQEIQQMFYELRAREGFNPANYTIKDSAPLALPAPEGSLDEITDQEKRLLGTVATQNSALKT